MSYRKSHIKSRIHRIKPKKSVLKSKWFWLSVLILIFVLAVAYFLVLFPGVQIKNIEISGNQRVASQDIKNLVENSINDQFSRSIFLVSANNVEKELLQNFPAIESVKIKRKLFQTLGLQISERAPVSVFCPPSEESGCYFLDFNGVAFESVIGTPQAVIIVRQMTGDKRISLGQNALAKNIMDLILKVQKSLKDNFQIDVKEVLVKSQTRLDITTSEDWKIYFDTSADINLQLTKLNLLLGQEISPSQRENLRYINLIPNSKAIICDNSTCGG